MNTTKNCLLALGLLSVVACSAATTDGEDPTTGAGTSPVASAETAESPDLAKTIEQREATATSTGRSLLDHSSAVDAALRRHGLDPEQARNEAMAIKDAKSDAERETLLLAFTAKYEKIARDIAPMLPAAIESGALGNAGDQGAVPVPSTDGYETNAHTACTTTTDTAPYASSVPPPPAGSSVSGFMSVLVTGGFADGGTRTSMVRSGPIAVSAADSTVNVTANVALESGYVEVWSGLFGYANAGVSLNLVVKGSDGSAICAQELKLADLGVNVGNVKHTIPAGNYALSCRGTRARDASLGVTAEVTLGAWNAAGGAAGAHAQATARLSSLTGRNCVEPGIFFDAEGLCVKPLSSTVGSSAQLAACDSAPGNKWTFDSASGLIRNRVSGLCLTVDPLVPRIDNYTAVAMRACEGAAGSLRQRWTRLADGKLRSQAAATPAPGFCLDGYGGGGPGAPLHMWECRTPAGKNQRWFFQP